MRTQALADKGILQAGFRIYQSHNKMIQDATEQERQRLGLPKLSTASYIRRRLLPLNAEELGIECPEFASLDGPNDVIAQAAARRNMNVKEFKELAARQLAAQELSAASQPPPSMGSQQQPMPLFRNESSATPQRGNTTRHPHVVKRGKR
jgi:hypothetical protein